MATTYNIAGGLDIGNGYVKGKFSVNGDAPETVDLPSCVAYIPTRKAALPAEPSDAYMDDLVNELECTMRSESLDKYSSKALLMGTRALTSNNSVVMFDINNTEKKKCDEPLSMHLAFGVLASLALKHYWAEHHELPEDKLVVQALMAVALPIADYTSHRTAYAAKLTHGIHTVHINNFERDVTVDIDIVRAPVVPEGAAAQYAITEMGPAFLDGVIAMCRESGMPIAEDETGEVIVTYMNTVGIDIGEGTVNFPVFRNGKIAAEASSSINRGYGSVLDEVVEQFRDENWAPKTRKGMSEFLLTSSASPTNRRLIESRIIPVLADALDVFADEVVREYNKVAYGGEVSPDVVYVYGGGSNGVRDALYPMLIETACIDEELGLYKPVLYMDAAYSRDLNRNGLYTIAAAYARALNEQSQGGETGQE